MMNQPSRHGSRRSRRMSVARGSRYSLSGNPYGVLSPYPNLREEHTPEDNNEETGANSTVTVGSCLPATDEEIKAATHVAQNTSIPFPNDDDSFWVVRHFLYDILTLHDWGISLQHPEAVRATVGDWFGTGYYLRQRYEEDNLKNICPNRGLRSQGAIIINQRVRDVIATCIDREIEKLIGRPDSYAEQEYGNSMIDTPFQSQEDLWDAYNSLRPSRSPRPRAHLPEQWAPPSVHRPTYNILNANATSHGIGIAPRGYETHNDGPAVYQPSRDMSASNQRFESRERIHQKQDVSSRYEQISNDKPSKSSLRKRTFKSMRDLMSHSKDRWHESDQRPTQTATDNGIKSVRFEDTIAGQPPVIESTSENDATLQTATAISISQRRTPVVIQDVNSQSRNDDNIQESYNTLSGRASAILSGQVSSEPRDDDRYVVSASHAQSRSQLHDIQEDVLQPAVKRPRPSPSMESIERQIASQQLHERLAALGLHSPDDPDSSRPGVPSQPRNYSGSLSGTIAGRSIHPNAILATPQHRAFDVPPYIRVDEVASIVDTPTETPFQHGQVQFTDQTADDMVRRLQSGQQEVMVPSTRARTLRKKVSHGVAKVFKPANFR